jgi:flagellar capping protein FliD
MLNFWRDLSLARMFKRFRFWLGNFLRWLARTKGVAAFALGVLLSLYLWSLTGTQVTVFVRKAGLSLQIGSGAILAYRLGVLQKHFDATPWWTKPWAWIRDFPTRFKPEPQVVHGESATMSVSAGTGTVERSSETLEERVDRLESELEGVKDRLEEVKADLLEKHDALREDFEEYKERQSAKMNQIRESFEKVTIGDLWMEGVALGWLLIGRIMTNEPEFIGHVLRLL